MKGAARAWPASSRAAWERGLQPLLGPAWGELGVGPTPGRPLMDTLGARCPDGRHFSSVVRKTLSLVRGSERSQCPLIPASGHGSCRYGPSRGGHLAQSCPDG